MEGNRCTQCGTPVVAGAALCANCANAASQAPPAYSQPVAPAAASGNGKLYSILAYFGILFLVGMFAAPEKDDPKVKFHVGQGMILTIAQVGAAIVVLILMVFFSILSGFTSGIISGLFGSLMGLCGLLAFVVNVGGFALMVMGALGASKGEEKPLPVIGKFAFYPKDK